MYRQLGPARHRPEAINPLTLRVLADAGTDASWARTSVTGFLGRPFDYVVTVCDQARQSCPVLPGFHRQLHWDFEDPAAVEGTEGERLAAFRRTLESMGREVDAFIPAALGASTLSGS